VLLVLDRTESQVSALLGGLAFPRDTRFQATDGNAGTSGVHLSQVNGDTINLHKELVPWSPVVNLVQGKLNGNPVCHHGFWSRA
jgi:hypothetical protein